MQLRSMFTVVVISFSLSSAISANVLRPEGVTLIVKAFMDMTGIAGSSVGTYQSNGLQDAISLPRPVSCDVTCQQQLKDLNNNADIAHDLSVAGIVMDGIALGIDAFLVLPFYWLALSCDEEKKCASPTTTASYGTSLLFNMVATIVAAANSGLLGTALVNSSDVPSYVKERIVSALVVSVIPLAANVVTLLAAGITLRKHMKDNSPTTK